MSNDITYESESCTVAACVTALSQALGKTFQERESDYFGGTYFKLGDAKPAARSLKVVRNSVFYDGSLTFSDHARDATLVLVEDAHDPHLLDLVLGPLGFTSGMGV